MEHASSNIQMTTYGSKRLGLFVQGWTYIWYLIPQVMDGTCTAEQSKGNMFICSTVSHPTSQSGTAHVQYMPH